MYTPGTIANSQTEGVPTKTSKNGAVAKVYKNFSGTRDTPFSLHTKGIINSQSIFVISSFFYFMKLKFIYVESSFHVIPT